MNKNLLLLIIVTVLVMGCSGRSLELAVPPATEVSQAERYLPWWSRTAMDIFMRYSVWSGDRSGFVTMVAQNGELIYSNTAGWADIEASIPMELGTQMRFASMTKPVTAVAAMILVEEGRLQLDDPVSKYIPAYGSLRVALNHNKDAEGRFSTEPLKNPLLVRHLLLFSSGIGPGYSEASDLLEHWHSNGLRSQKDGNLAQRIDHLASLPLFEEPGSRWRYGSSADALARVVEVASGQSFHIFLKERIFVPLGMSNTSFLYEIKDKSRLATVYTQDKNGDLALAPKLIDADYNQGGSGLVSTAGDYMRFALMLWNQGKYQGIGILNSDTVAEMTRLHLKEGVFEDRDVKGLGWGLGMSVLASEDAALPGHLGDFGWGGYYGTTFFVSPSTGMVGVVLSQNEMSEFSDDYQTQIYVLQGLALAGS
jgi:CubicO group peptidase (beta-lactamase class C family)